MNHVCIHRLRSKFRARSLNNIIVDIGDNQSCPGFVQVLAESVSDVAEPLHGDSRATERRVAAVGLV